MTIAVAVSGGVDSLVALALLKDRGHDVLALHARFLPPATRTESVLNGLSEVCDRLGVPLELVDLQQEFHSLVVRPFVKEYLDGRTPNPCAWCNRSIKFGLLLDAALELGADSMATGHYARVEHDPAHPPALYRGADPVKEQSYFLSLLTPGQLCRAHFPLGGLLKSRVQQEAARRGLPVPAVKESQEICFVPGNDYRSFIEQQGVQQGVPLPGPGDVSLASGRVVGRHLGLWRYTLGQRRGLGIAHSEPLYVLGRDTASNTLLVGPREELMTDRCTVSGLNMLVPFKQWPSPVLVQTIYRHAAKPAEVTPVGERFTVRFRSPRAKAAPGQVAAFYSDRGRVLAGGTVHG